MGEFLRWEGSECAGLVTVRRSSVLTGGGDTMRKLWGIALAGLLFWLASGLVLAQVLPTGSLTGIVEDPSGAAVVGAQVQVVDAATGKVYETRSGADGHFQIANLPPGNYRVTVSMSGFQTAVYSGVQIIVGRVYDLRVQLKVGQLSATVVVEAGQEVLQTAQTSVGTTVTGEAITRLPFTSRDTLDLALADPGAQTAGRPRNSSFEGLPKGSINITLDGINVQDNLLKSNDGFFSIIRPRVDAIAEFNITTAASDAASAGEGAVQINFVSQRGSNAFHGGAWEYLRNDFLNSNYYFNNLNGLPRQVMRLNQFGYKVGGPILKDKLFFFTDLDVYTFPQSLQRTQTILNNNAAHGLFTYAVSTVPASTPPWVTCDATKKTCTANLLQMGQNFGGPGARDTFVARILDAMLSAESAPGVKLNAAPSLFQDSLSFLNRGTSTRYFPDLRLDWNITQNHSFEFVYHYNSFNSSPDFLNGFDPVLPVPPFTTNVGSQVSNRNLFVGAWRWTIGVNKSNELRFGIQSAPVSFFPDQPLSFYPTAQTNLGQVHVRPIFGPAANNLMNEPFLAYATQGRNFALGQLIDNFAWTRGTHNMAFGVSMTEIMANEFFASPLVRTVFLGLSNADPLFTQFNSSNLPGISAADLTTAANLYGVLTGRVINYTGSVFLNPATRQFQTGFPEKIDIHQFEMGLYAQDSWRVRPTLTVNYGLRWEYEGIPSDQLNEFFNLAGGVVGVYGVSGLNNLFKPGTLQGSTPVYVLNGSSPWWKPYYKGFAPSLGLAWQPPFQNSWWQKIFGKTGDTVFRAAYGVSYSREGLNNFLSLGPSNPGFFGTQFMTPVAASPGPGQFVAGSVQLQNFSFDNVAQNPAQFNTSFPLSATSGNGVNAFAPDLRMPFIQSWTVGVQRALGQNMALEIRYVGNHATRLWRQVNLNEVNIFENGFLNEFRNALTNLQICQQNASACLAAQQAAGVPASGRTTNSFANWGLSGQQPLPILTAAFTGSTSGSQTNANFRSGTFVSFLQNGLAGAFANSLALGSITFWNNMVAAGFPSNFWIVNPDARGGSFLLYNGAQSTYNALQVIVRRRPSKGLQFDASYNFSKSLTDYYANSSVSFNQPRTLRDPHLNKGPAPFDIRHAFKLTGLYDFPFGRGNWRTPYGFVNKLIEGWQLSTITRWQSGRVTLLTSGLGGTFNQNDPGIIMNGVTTQQLQAQLGVFKTATPAPGAVWYVPFSLLDSNHQRANPAILQSCNRPGQFCNFVFFYGPPFFKADIGVGKRTYITEQVNFEIRAEFLNAFNNANFFWAGDAAAVATTQSIQSTSFGRIFNAYQDISTTDDPGGRIVQLVFRINF
jgi:hypothetical protein